MKCPKCNTEMEYSDDRFDADVPFGSGTCVGGGEFWICPKCEHCEDYAGVENGKD